MTLQTYETTPHPHVRRAYVAVEFELRVRLDVEAEDGSDAAEGMLGLSEEEEVVEEEADQLLVALRLTTHDRHHHSVYFIQINKKKISKVIRYVGAQWRFGISVSRASDGNQVKLS